MLEIDEKHIDARAGQIEPLPVCVIDRQPGRLIDRRRLGVAGLRRSAQAVLGAVRRDDRLPGREQSVQAMGQIRQYGRRVRQQPEPLADRRCRDEFFDAQPYGPVSHHAAFS